MRGDEHALAFARAPAAGRWNLSNSNGYDLAGAPSCLGSRSASTSPIQLGVATSCTHDVRPRARVRGRRRHRRFSPSSSLSSSPSCGVARRLARALRVPAHARVRRFERRRGAIVAARARVGGEVSAQSRARRPVVMAVDAEDAAEESDEDDVEVFANGVAFARAASWFGASSALTHETFAAEAERGRVARARVARAEIGSRAKRSRVKCRGRTPRRGGDANGAG